MLVTAALGTGCGFFMEPKPDLENKKTATVSGLSVTHPGNWKTELESEDVEGATFSSLSIESSGSALAMIQVFEPGIEMTPKDVFQTYVEGMLEASQEEFGGVFDLKLRSDDAFSREVLGSTWQGRTGVLDLKLLGENVPHRIQSVQRFDDDKTIIIVVQAPVEDWKTVSPGFDAIYDGLSEE